MLISNGLSLSDSLLITILHAFYKVMPVLPFNESKIKKEMELQNPSMQFLKMELQIQDFEVYPYCSIQTVSSPWSLLWFCALVFSMKSPVHHSIHQFSDREQKRMRYLSIVRMVLLSRGTYFLWFLFGGTEFAPTRWHQEMEWRCSAYGTKDTLPLQSLT